MLAKHDYEILVDPDQNLGWKWIKNGPIPLGAFDAGHAPLLGKKYLCLKPIRGKPYQGLVIGNQCHYRLKDQIHQTQTYQVLVQYWVKTKKIPPEVPASGRDESGDLYICRVQHHGIYYPGTTGVGVRSCKFIDEYGYEMVSKHYEVQLHLPHKWVKGHPERGLENMVNTGYQSKYYVCRAKFLRNVYIGKIQRGEPFCNVAIGGGQLNLKNYQLQIRTKQ